MKKVNILLCFVLLSTIVIFDGCKKEKEKEPSAPEIPPSSTFFMDFETFPSTNRIMQPDTHSTPDSSVVKHAIMNVAFWNFMVAITMYVPTLSFIEAFNHEGVHQDDGSWIWSYNFGTNNIYTAALHAKLVSDSVNWEMYISRQNVYTDLLWYSGTSAFNGSGGYWILNKDENNPTPFIEIDWNRNTSDGTWDIKYTNIIPGDAGNGGYIYNGVTNSTTYDRFYDIYYIEKTNLIEIDWNSTTRVGQIKDSIKFGDTNWHCWNNNLVNSVCP